MEREKKLVVKTVKHPTNFNIFSIWFKCIAQFCIHGFYYTIKWPYSIIACE